MTMSQATGRMGPNRGAKRPATPGWWIGRMIPGGMEIAPAHSMPTCDGMPARWSTNSSDLKSRYGPMMLTGAHGPYGVDVTLRRVQAFRCRPGELVEWRVAGQRGEARADEHGELTIPHVPVTASWQTLIVARQW